MPGWDGTSRAVAVKVTDGGKSDTIQLYTDTGLGTQINLGSVAANADFVSSNTVYDAAMVQSADKKAVTLTTGRR